MRQEWRCTKCNTLLGMSHEMRLHLRYKEAQYIIGGGNFYVTAVCRKCSSINEWHNSSPANKYRRPLSGLRA